MPERVDLDRIREYRSHGYIEVAIPSIDARLKAVEEEAFRLKDENARLKEELAKRQWISVEDRMPRKRQKVLVYFSTDPEPYMDVWTYDGRNQYFRPGKVKIPMVTHWMPRPDPPKKEIL